MRVRTAQRRRFGHARLLACSCRTIYAFEALFFLGWLLAYPTLGHVVILATWAALQIGRIVREERILGGYDEYRQTVRWRIMPFVW